MPLSFCALYYVKSVFKAANISKCTRDIIFY